MARRKTNDLENQMSLMDMIASESPEYTEEGPEELLDPGEDMEDSEGQTDKPFKLVANKTTKAKASISTQALSVVKAVYADTVETNWEELFDGFDRLYAITFSSGIEFVNKVINKFSYAEVVFGCEKIIANDIAAIMSVQIDSVQRLAKSKSAGNLANRLDDGSLQLYVSRDTKSHEKIFILESADHKRVRVITGSANMSASAFCGIQRENIVCFDEMTTEMRENANGKEYFPDIFHASSSVIADIFEACGIDLPDYVRVLYYNDYMGDESIGRAAIEKIELAWQADPSKFRGDKKQNRLIYSYPPDGPWYELKYIADELPNSLEAEISGGNQLIMNYEQAQELFGIKFRRWLGIFNL